MWANTDEEIDYLSSSFRKPSPGTFPAETQSRLPDLRHTPRLGLGRLKLPKWLRAWLQREAVRGELHQLNPKTLADLGISRADFPAILAGTFTRNAQAPET